MQYKVPEVTIHNDIETTVTDEAVAALDAIQRAMAHEEARVIAITSPRHGVGTESICTMLAHSIATGNSDTLLIDASQSQSPADGHNSWIPGEPLVEAAIQRSSATQRFDLFRIQPTTETRPIFNNLARMQKSLQRDLRTYDAIIINLSPVLETTVNVVNPVSIAAAADVTYLACATNQTSISDVQRSIEALHGGNVKIGGTILDNSNAVYPGQEIANKIERNRLLPASFRNRIAKLFRTSELFN